MSDPLNLGPDPQRELFNRLRKAANGFPVEHVSGAAANVLINALRQEHPNRAAAIKSFDELAARMKFLLMEHYDSQGRKKGVFPFRQVIHAPFVVDKDKVI